MCAQRIDPREAVCLVRQPPGVRERMATPDVQHADQAVAFAELGYHLLLEKPMAPTPDACRRIVATVTKTGVVLAVCHVLRYTRYTERLKRLVASGRIGQVASLSHLEPVGYWHQAHSFVRGNWGNEAASAPMLLAKSCHDLDWIGACDPRRVLSGPDESLETHLMAFAAEQARREGRVVEVVL